MLGSIFYHNTLRKYATVFGNMFNDVVVRRFDGSTTLQTITVPIKYSSKARYMAQLQRNQEVEKVQVQLPSMSFMMTNFQYDSNRKTSALNQYRSKIGNVTSIVKTSFWPVPYNIEFELTCWAKTHEDMWQIMEQIIPYFHPSFTQEVKLVPEMDLKFDIKTTLGGFSLLDDFADGPVEESGVLQWTFQFTMEGIFFGPVTNAGLIKRVQVDLHVVPGDGKIIETDNYQGYGRSERLVITPGLTANGQPTSNSSLTIPYTEIEYDDPYGFVEQLYFFEDSKSYDPVSGTDR